MVPAVYQALKARHEAQGRPAEGWVFPTASASGHMEETSAKQWHAKALAALAKANKEDPEVKPFEPYCRRHTFGTRMAPNCDVFTLARFMGHNSITITQRCCHPQADALEQAFVRMANGRELVTEGGHLEIQGAESAEPAEVVSLAVSVR